MCSAVVSLMCPYLRSELDRIEIQSAGVAMSYVLSMKIIQESHSIFNTEDGFLMLDFSECIGWVNNNTLPHFPLTECRFSITRIRK